MILRQQVHLVLMHSILYHDLFFNLSSYLTPSDLPSPFSKSRYISTLKILFLYPPSFLFLLPPITLFITKPSFFLSTPITSSPPSPLTPFPPLLATTSSLPPPYRLTTHPSPPLPSTDCLLLPLPPSHPRQPHSRSTNQHSPLRHDHHISLAKRQ